MLKICADIVDMKTNVWCIDKDLSLIDSQKFETYIDHPETEFTKIINIANEFSKKYNNVAQSTLNIAMPGPCDYTEGLFLNPPNLQKYVGFNAGDFIKAQSA